MYSKSGEEQKEKVITSVEVLISTRIQQKKGQNNNALIRGRLSINTCTWPSPSNALILDRVLGLDSAHPYCSTGCS